MPDGTDLSSVRASDNADRRAGGTKPPGGASTSAHRQDSSHSSGPGHSPDSSPDPGHGGHPHSDDHDEHRSRWPLLAALGSGGLYAGFGIFFIGRATGTIPPLVGIVMAIGGFAVLIGGTAGWLLEAYIRPLEMASGARKSRETYVSTTVLFLVTDVATFGAVFVYYFVMRIGAWPPQEVPPLLGSLVLINTAILVASSFTIHFAHNALHKGNQRRFLGLLGTTFVLGVIFLGGQIYEYYEFIVAEGFTQTTGFFGSAFYGLTGLHGIHVAIGVGALGVLLARALTGAYNADRDTSVATVSIYWHFVDVVWLFLVVVLYAGAAL